GVRPRKGVRPYPADEHRVVLVLDAAAARLLGPVDEASRLFEGAREPALLLQATHRRRPQVLSDPRMAAAGVRPVERPEHLLPAALLDEELAPVAENEDREGLV